MMTYKEVAAVVLAGVGAGYLLRRAFDTQFTGSVPRYSGAISAVTGGPPEDMNAMPAVASVNGAIWDGSHL